MMIKIQLVISILWSCRVASAADNSNVPQECRLSLPDEYSKLIPPVQRVCVIVIMTTVQNVETFTLVGRINHRMRLATH